MTDRLARVPGHRRAYLCYWGLNLVLLALLLLYALRGSL